MSEALLDIPFSICNISDIWFQYIHANTFHICYSSIFFDETFRTSLFNFRHMISKPEDFLSHSFRLSTSDASAQYFRDSAPLIQRSLFRTYPYMISSPLSQSFLIWYPRLRLDSPYPIFLSTLSDFPYLILLFDLLLLHVLLHPVVISIILDLLFFRIVLSLLHK